ncbi:hypothetical protein ACU4GH_15465 [Bradyrhizobium betae]
MQALYQQMRSSGTGGAPKAAHSTKSRHIIENTWRHAKTAKSATIEQSHHHRGQTG